MKNILLTGFLKLKYPLSSFQVIDAVINVFTGYWNIIVYGRKHSYRLYTKMLNEAMRWTAAIQGVIDSKTPIETPTLQLIRDIKVKHIQRYFQLTLNFQMN